ncbi:hypothetical protein, partial [Comamonas sp.]|uniref:hypothetical protein n=1 Tax=Comamonas sp. TaxID=34028 RepID=UPI00258C49FA
AARWAETVRGLLRMRSGERWCWTWQWKVAKTFSILEQPGEMQNAAGWRCCFLVLGGFLWGLWVKLALFKRRYCFSIFAKMFCRYLGVICL